MSKDMLRELMNGQSGMWTIAVIAGVLAGLFDLWMSYRSWRAERIRAQSALQAADMEEAAPGADPSTSVPAAPLAPPIAASNRDAAPAQTLIQPAPSTPPASVPSFPRRRAAFEVDPSLTAEELLERAEQHMASGARDQAAAHFRGAIRMAQKNKLPAVEARARIELGDLSRENGDLTSACEHWQMARVLFDGLGKPADVKATIERMEKNGCPSDWVLNEF